MINELDSDPMPSDADWYAAQEKPLDAVTVKELEALGAAIFEQRTKIEEMEAKVSVENKILATMQTKFTAYLKEFGKTSYSIAEVGTFTAREKLSVTLPQGEAREQFYTWLKERGVFEQMVSVNYNTLNSLYKEEFELAKNEGRADKFEVPGIGAPTYSTSLAFKRGVKK